MSAPEASELTLATAQQAELQPPSSLALNAQREEEIYRRYSRIEKPKPEVVYEFTRDPALLHQYYQLRGEQYYSTWGQTNYTYGPDEYDAKAHILIARYGDQCVGGCRLIVKTPRSRRALALEGNDGFNLQESFPEMNLESKKYGEYSGFVMLPEFRITGYQELFMNLYRRARGLGLEYVFGVATMAQARMYRRICVALGLHFVLPENVAPSYKDYIDQEVYLMMGRLAGGDTTTSTGVNAAELELS